MVGDSPAPRAAPSVAPGGGYGFISCEAFPDKDIFVLKSELPGGFGPQGGLCKFKVSHEDKGPSAKDGV